MLIQKIHFEQIPLETVRKMVEEQIRQEVPAQYDQAIGRNSADEIPLEVRDQPIAEPAPSFSRRYSSNAEAQSQKIPRRFQRGN
jgi:hypothetical protein